MSKIMVYYAGEDVEEFLRNMLDFPEVVIILPRDKEEYKTIAEELNRIVTFMDFDEVKLFLKPDYIYYYSNFGKEIEEVAAKVKNHFNVLICFKKNEGTPISLDRKIREEVAAPIILYEIHKLVKYY